MTAAALAVDTPGGQRIRLDALFSAMTPADRRAWFCWAGQATSDEYGLHLRGVELFLESRVRQRELF